MKGELDMIDKTRIEDIRQRLSDNGKQLVDTLRASREALTQGDYDAAKALYEKAEKLLREREANNQLVAREIANLLRKRLSDLHGQRSVAVLEARTMRINFGVRSKMFSDEWSNVEELTAEIETFERHLQTVEADAVPNSPNLCPFKEVSHGG